MYNQNDEDLVIVMTTTKREYKLKKESRVIDVEITKQRRAYQSQYRRSRSRGKRSTPLPTEMPRSGT